MEELLASLANKTLNFSRGDEISGQVVAVNQKEIILDLGIKSEGVLPTKDLPKDQLDKIKVGSDVTAYVADSDNESGQIILSTRKLAPKTLGFSRDNRSGLWDKFSGAKDKKSILVGKVLEINKGGLIVEVDGIRGFLPSSLVGGEVLLGSLGQEIKVVVTEVDKSNNRLIFSQKGQVDETLKAKLAQYKTNQKVKGKIVAILPFALVISLPNDGEGVVFIGDVSWEKVEDLNSQFKVGDEIEAIVLGKDEGLGRINLSTKNLSEDPFTKLTEKLHPDSTVKGTVQSITSSGVNISLDDDITGFIPSSKIEGLNYEVGKEVTITVGSIDKARRRVNLTPFITTTKGLIYK